jgi:hypothetical protein
LKKLAFIIISSALLFVFPMASFGADLQLKHPKIIVGQLTAVRVTAKPQAPAATTSPAQSPDTAKTGSDTTTPPTPRPLANLEIHATYFPNSSVERVQVIGVTDSEGWLQWIPQYAGLAKLAIASPKYKASRIVSIYYTGLPISGLLIFLLASTVLFGAMVYGFKQSL